MNRDQIKSYGSGVGAIQHQVRKFRLHLLSSRGNYNIFVSYGFRVSDCGSVTRIANPVCSFLLLLCYFIAFEVYYGASCMRAGHSTTS